jgi:hypothetical protein
MENLTRKEVGLRQKRVRLSFKNTCQEFSTPIRVLMHDNARLHTAKRSQKWLKDTAIEVMECATLLAKPQPNRKPLVSVEGGDLQTLP